MNELNFEWDAMKAAENDAKHGVSFEHAKLVFDDPFAIEHLDDRIDYGEERFILVGLSQDFLLTVVYTERDDRIRLISARYATRYEQDDYVEQNT